jgi:hypothetical protein
VKPVAMIADAILDCSARGDIVLDNFSGVGSTILAAEKVGRVCYAIEIDPLYVDTAVSDGKSTREKKRSAPQLASTSIRWRCSMANDMEYEVGYKKPPKAFQFQKGTLRQPEWATSEGRSSFIGVARERCETKSPEPRGN